MERSLDGGGLYSSMQLIIQNTISQPVISVWSLKIVFHVFIIGVMDRHALRMDSFILLYW